ncbi:D-2-hydroxyacid dehydrogenase family protein [Bacillus sp. 31A1R]|uniref:D-2-hydroxyacid dehydrogenase family protein n=1 Tax=Robertmurraya mangrovi TaxID=3098077 RepID=A0ABU5IVU9_9BACI|nr:D-2-hydroxyacid dehydrogenase family protein [Bacillus sp. 31A1R]MDZ5471283.1 D-2-hydroxyacid dehydrogenase family protein [Bacillus sp. 31A1R]
MKVVILDDWEGFYSNHPQVERLRSHFEVEVYNDQPTKTILIERIRHADVIIPIRERTKFTKDILQQLQHIKLIAQTGAGLAHIDMDEAIKLHIPVSTTPGGSAAVVELIFGMMINLSRKLLPLHQDLKNRIWQESVGLSLENKTVGIIGLGKIGSGVANIAKAFNMNVVAWGPRLTEERASAQGVTYTSLEELLQRSHFIVIAVRLVPETKLLLTEHHFNLMRKDAFLINTSRGEILDETALIKALSTDKIAGAGLDVFTEEPINEDNPLLTLDNVLLSPHIGWKTDNMFNQFLTTAADNILAFFIDKNPTRIVNPDVLSVQ